jgi:endonuclease/exonuclease/phosphatase family metal-dependent hydrolase
MSSATRRPLVGVLLAGALLALALLAPVANAASDSSRPVKVMTRNLYLGADLTPAIVAQTPLALAQAGTQIWNTVQATDFPARAKLLAKEIQDADPALIGLQEAAIWRTGPSDGIPALGGGAAPNVVYDYLASLQAELAAIGSPYVLVKKQQEADIEGPTTLGMDIRLTQQDVILARKSSVDDGSITWANEQSGQYPHNATFQLSLPLLGGLVSVESTRGYVAADFVVNKRAFRLVDTHLEAFHPGVRAQQAGFLASAGPANVGGKLVLIGDLNSDPNGSFPGSLAVNTLLGTFGFTDSWAQINPTDPGFTSGFGEFVNDPDTSAIDSRIDHVLTRGGVDISKSKVTGLDPSNRSPAGLWPSDHAGVVATLQP